ncbi:MAG: hypothetical protein RI897_2176 [Verrucomicrobiota bacterium]
MDVVQRVALSVLDGAGDPACGGEVEVDVWGIEAGVDCDRGCRGGGQSKAVVLVLPALGCGWVSAQDDRSHRERAELVRAVGAAFCRDTDVLAGEGIEGIEVDVGDGVAGHGIGDEAAGGAGLVESEVDTRGGGIGDDGYGCGCSRGERGGVVEAHVALEEGGVGADEVIAGEEGAELVGAVGSADGVDIETFAGGEVDIEIDGRETDARGGDGACQAACSSEGEVDIAGNLARVDRDERAGIESEGMGVVDPGEALGDRGIDAEAIIADWNRPDGEGAVGIGGGVIWQALSEFVIDVEVDTVERVAEIIGDRSGDPAAGLEGKVDS